MTWSEVTCNLKEMMRSPKYLVIAVLTAVLFVTITIGLLNRKTLEYVLINEGFGYTLSLLGIFIIGFAQTVTPANYLAFILSSILVGILVSTILYRREMHQATSPNASLLTTLGAGIGIIAPGCAVCGLGLLPLAGVLSGSVLALFPLKGLEISLAGLVLLGFSLWKLASFKPSQCAR